MKSVLKIIFSIAFAAILLSGCSKISNPVQPEPGDNSGHGGDPDPVTINTPVKMHITEIRVNRFPEKKPDGKFWDVNNPILPLIRRPDVYVKLSQGSTKIYRSNTEEDAYYLSTYTFTKAGVLNGSDLPYDAIVTKEYRLEVMDDDVAVDDNMATLTFTPIDYYNNDNAVTFGINKEIGGVGIQVYGTWVY